MGFPRSLLKRLGLDLSPGGHSRASRRQEQPLAIRRLERRRVLSADFGLINGALTLDNFSAQETLTLSRNGDSYEFVLSQGDWYEDGVAEASSLAESAALPGSGLSSMLALSAAEVQSITINASNLNLVLGDIDFGFDTLDFNGISAVNQDLGTRVSAGMMDISSPGDLHFNSLNLTGGLNVQAGGDITDSSTMTIIGDADFTAAGSITLNENAGDVLHVTGRTTLLAGDSILVGAAGSFQSGSLNFNASGNVSIQEDGDGFAPTMVLSGSNTAGSLLLEADGAVTDEPGATLDVSSDATIIATDFAPASDFDLNGVVDEADHAIWSANQGGPPGSPGDANGDGVTDAADYTIWREQLGATAQAGEITLADSGDNALTVSDKASFTSSGDISIGAAGEFNAALLNFNAPGLVSIQEVSSTAIVMDNTAGTLMLASGGDIIDGDPAETPPQSATTIAVTGDATFTAEGSITLANTVDDVLAVAGQASFAAGVNITVGPAGEFTAGQLNFNAPGVVSIQEDIGTPPDVALAALDTSPGTVIVMNNTAGTLLLASDGDIVDGDPPFFPSSGTTISVAGDATFTSAGAIALADNAADMLNVAGKASFSSAGSITVGPAGVFTAGQLNFNAPGTVLIQEDVGQSDPTPGTLVAMANTAGELQLTSSGSIADAAGADIKVAGAASFLATGAIVFGNLANEGLAAGGQAYFQATSTVSVGTVGYFAAGTLRFNAPGAVTIREGSSVLTPGTMLSGASTAGSLELTTLGMVEDAAGASLVVTNNATVKSVEFFTTADFDGNMIVEAADYAIWRANYGLLNAPGDANGDGVTDAADYTIWRDELALSDQPSGITLANQADNTLTVGGKAAFTSDAFITVGRLGDFNAGLLNFNAPGTVLIQEDSSTAIAMSNTAGTLNLTSTGDITDEVTPDPSMPAMMLATQVTVTGAAAFTSGGSITLGDTAPAGGKAGDVLSVTGKASFIANPLIAGSSITIGPQGTFNAGQLSFNAPGLVDIQEDSSTALAMSNTAGTLILNSRGSITDVMTPDPLMPTMMLATQITVTGAATFTATSGGSITLGDTAPAGGKAGDQLEVTGKASFTSAGGVKIGPQGVFNAGQLSFNAPGVVDIQEDSSTAIAMSNTAGTLILTSTGSITDVMTPDPAMPTMMLATQITVTGAATFTATSGGSITLGDTAPAGAKLGDRLEVTGTASFTADNAIKIGPQGVFNAGLLTFNAPGLVDIQEDSGTAVVNINTAGTLVLTSAAGITDGNPAQSPQFPTTIMVTGDATFISGASIALADTTGDILTVSGKASFSSAGNITVGSPGVFNAGLLNFNAPNQVAILEGSSTAIAMSNTAGTLNLTSAGDITDVLSPDPNMPTMMLATQIVVSGAATFGSGGSITLADTAPTGGKAGDVLQVMGKASFNAVPLTPNASIKIGSQGTFNAGLLNFNAPGLVDIQEDSSTAIAMRNTAGTLILASTGSITDVMTPDPAMPTMMLATQITVTGAATFTATAGGSITLGDTAPAGGKAGDQLEVTGKASFTSGGGIKIGPQGIFNAGLLNFNAPGLVDIQEDSSTAIAMSNTAGTLLLNSAGGIVDGDPAQTPTPATQVIVTGDATFAAAGAVTLANTVGDLLSVIGKASFSSTSSITIGPAGNFVAGLLNFNAPGAVTIQEDSSTAIAMNNTAGTLVLSSAGNITDALSPDPAMPAMMLATQITVTGAATFTSGGSITLGDTAPAGGKAGDVLSVAGKASFTASPLIADAFIKIGPQGMFNAGLLNFNAPGLVDIQEDSSTAIAMSNTAGTLVLTSAGAIVDGDPAQTPTPATQVVVSGAATFNSGGSITLANTTGDVLSVSGKASFIASPLIATSSITIGPAGVFNAGLLNFNAPGAVTIQEDSSTAIAMSNTAGTLNLTSNGNITDQASPDPAMPTMMLATQIVVSGGATFTAASGGSITLGDTAPAAGKAGDVLSVTGKASFTSAGGIKIGPQGNFNAGLLSFNAPGLVDIQEDSSTAIVMSNTAGTLILTSAAGIVDGDPAQTPPMATTIVATGDATFNSGASITLTDNDGDMLSVTGRASFNADGNVTVGRAPVLVSFNAGQLNFNSPGVVTIYEGSDMVLAGMNSAGVLILTSAGSITDAAPTVVEPFGTDVTIFQSATLNAPTGDVVLGESGESFAFDFVQPFDEAKFLALQAVNVSIVASSGVNLQTLTGANASVFAGSFFLTASQTIAQVGQGADLGTLTADVVALNSKQGAVLFSGIELTRPLDYGNLQPNLSIHSGGSVDYDAVLKGQRLEFPLDEIEGNTTGTSDGAFLPTNYDRDLIPDLTDPDRLRDDGSHLVNVAGAQLSEDQPYSDVAAYVGPDESTSSPPFFLSAVAVVYGDAVVGRVVDQTSIVLADDAVAAGSDDGDGGAPSTTREQVGVKVSDNTGNAYLRTYAIGETPSDQPASGDSSEPTLAALAGTGVIEAGDIVFTSISHTTSEVVRMQQGVFTAIAAGELSIDTMSPDQLKATTPGDTLRTTKLTTSTGTVTSVARYQAPLGAGAMDVFDADGPRFILDLPSELATAATTGLVRAVATEDGVVFEQRLTFAIGSRGEDGLIVEFEWADVKVTRDAQVDAELFGRDTIFLKQLRPETLPADIDGTILNPEVALGPAKLDFVSPQSVVALPDNVLLVQTDSNLLFRVVTVRHEFDPTFIPDNPTKPDLPTTIRVYNDPGINLYDQGGARNLNDAVNFVSPEARFVEPGFSEPSQLQMPDLVPPREIEAAELAVQVTEDQPARFVPRQVIADFGDKIKFGLIDEETKDWAVAPNGEKVWPKEWSDDEGDFIEEIRQLIDNGPAPEGLYRIVTATNRGEQSLEEWRKGDDNQQSEANVLAPAVSAEGDGRAVQPAESELPAPDAADDAFGPLDMGGNEPRTTGITERHVTMDATAESAEISVFAAGMVGAAGLTLARDARPQDPRVRRTPAADYSKSSRRLKKLRRAVSRLRSSARDQPRPSQGS